MAVIAACIAVAAWGAPPPPVAEVPRLRSDWSVQAAALVGVDRWTDGGGPAAEARLSAWGSRPVGGWTVAGGYGGVVETLPLSGVAAYDLHAAEVAFTRGRRWIGGAAIGGQAGLATQTAWFDAAPAAVVTARAGRGQVTARIGGGVRWDVNVADGGPMAALVVQQRAGVAWSGGIRGSARAFVAGGLPPALVQVDLWGRWQPSDVFAADAGAGTVVTAGGGRALGPVAGLAAPGTAVARGQVGAEWTFSKAVGVRAEVAGELGLGTLAYQRIRAFAGVVVRAGRRPIWTPEPPGRVRLTVVAPDAERVEVLGSFTGWEARPLVREGRRWAVDLDLAPGEYPFVFRIDGETSVPVDRPTRPDGFGGVNAILVVAGR